MKYFMLTQALLIIQGSYSEPVGLQIVRNHVAQYIERRDGFPADPDNIIVCSALEGIRVNVLTHYGIILILIILTFSLSLYLKCCLRLVNRDLEL